MSSTPEQHPSFCRICNVSCPLDVTVVDGRAVAVTGDRTNPFSGGYTCVKGRSQAHYYRHPDRVLTSLKRRSDGTFEPIPYAQAVSEIADKLRAILDRDGPRAVASYFGTYGFVSAVTIPFLNAFMSSIGSPMLFTPNTIDKPGKYIARAMHGRWMAPNQGYDRPDVGLLIGLNPFVSYQGLPHTNPGAWLSAAQERGFKLIVIDPRRTDVAKRAFIHLQIRPGHDAEVLAAIIRVLFEEGLCDDEFLRQNVEGVDALRAAVAPFEIGPVAARAGIDADDLRRAARTLGEAARGYSVCGTGPNMTGQGTLNEYLTLCLMTLRGFYLREGEHVLHQRTFMPAMTPKAQPAPRAKAYGFGEHLRVRGLTDTAAGLPTSALADEILLDGPGRVRALISCGGNPVSAWPDQLKTIEAMDDLELLVQVDPWMSQTARRAHYVIAPKMGFEVPGINFLSDFDVDFGAGYTRAEHFGQYAPAIVDVPPGSELIEEWELYYDLARLLGHQLVLSGGYLGAAWSGGHPVDMEHRPTTDELLAVLTRSARVPLDEVKRHPRGVSHTDGPLVVAGRDDDCTDRLDVGRAEMMHELGEVAGSMRAATADGSVGDAAYDLRLICRRVTHVMNSSYNFEVTNRGRAFNPAFVHPSELERRGLAAGDRVRVESERSSIPAVVMPDDNVRPGIVSMSHSFGGTPEDDDDYLSVGSCTGRLVADDQRYDTFSGQPRMSNVPVRLVTVNTAVDTSAGHR